ncbi:response regulator transcription factor [Hydrogenimonas thermophila]|uniref:DNA-binding response regulator, OmpR family, contains REC and winged-helix (WHTH) domain n=1 Tax=Hydrogenimonas thermophila TaxID=223786 RepID=A0A1I5QBC8_9BACT|nr:response regulator transcription factor [Hydrogenimonas thermophila]WOE70830.1 response regulator transcription factor [Hydrogenimonas thermophila]WOE73348.1 response regulator transcription factor [Hydrogenimonas thermophila]SFP43619.1 DNA-binding response regulator, OmpR family, contains REC and winged-helix (wHTH) domain [Hydrogenimonas thermophila]
MKVLLIEDDIQLNTTIKNFLESLNYEVISSFDGSDAIELIDENHFDLYLIDINIPNISGLDIVKYIRQKDTNVSIIMITASLEINNFIDAFDNGCNEYIKKPFHLKELEIRINNLLDKNSDKEEIIQISENIIYNMEYEELRIDNEIVPLRKKERRLLTILLQNVNHTVPTESICSYVWENEIKESYPLRQLANELRKKLEKDQKFIFTDIGVGYRFEIC